MSQNEGNSLDHCRRGRRTRRGNVTGPRTSTPGPNNESSSSEDFGDELTEYIFHFWLKALHREERRRRKCSRRKIRHNPASSVISSSPSPRPATSTSSSAQFPDFPVANSHFQGMCAPHLPVSRHYIMSHRYLPSENPARLVFIRPSPLYLPPPNTSLWCCPVIGYYENGNVGVIPYAFYCCYM